MTSRLYFRRRGRTADLIRCEGNGSSTLLYVEGVGGGYLKLADLTLPVTDGAARLDGRLIPDGEYAPILLTEGCELVLERFEMKGGRPRALPTEERVIRELLTRAAALEARVTEAERVIGELRERIASETIF